MILNGYNEGLIESIKNWLREDVGAGDVTTSVTIPAWQSIQGHYTRQRQWYYCRHDRS